MCLGYSRWCIDRYNVYQKGSNPFRFQDIASTHCAANWAAFKAFRLALIWSWTVPCHSRGQLNSWNGIYFPCKKAIWVSGGLRPPQVEAILKALNASDTNFIARIGISRKNRSRKQCNKNLLEKTPISLPSGKSKGQKAILKASEVGDTNFVARFGISTKSWSRKKKETK